MNKEQLQRDMLKVVDSLKRGHAGHSYSDVGDRFMFTIGAPTAIKIPGVKGMIVAVGIDKDQAKELRAALDKWMSA